MEDTRILDVTNDVKWIGVLNPDLRKFDIVMDTKYGTTYNSYFINAHKKVIIEASKAKFWDTYKNKILKVVKPEEIEFIIVNHTEPDHSGSIQNLLAIAPNATIVGSGNAVRYLKDIMNIDFKSKIVREGDTLDLGNKTLQFISAPNLHWPDSIFTYLKEDKVLFTCDCFGEHFCDERMFDDLVDDFEESNRYYFKVIMKPFSKWMLKAIEKIRLLDLKTICTGHGPILRTYWKKYVDLSEELALEAITARQIAFDNRKVLIAYVSAYGYTETLARAIAEGIIATGKIAVELCNLELSDLKPETLNLKLEESTGIIIGSPTINQNTLPQIYELLGQMNPLRDRGKLGAVFGSYGWSGEATEIIESTLKYLKLKLHGEKLTVKFKPSENELSKAKTFGMEFAERLCIEEIPC